MFEERERGRGREGERGSRLKERGKGRESETSQRCRSGYCQACVMALLQSSSPCSLTISTRTDNPCYCCLIVIDKTKLCAHNLCYWFVEFIPLRNLKVLSETQDTAFGLLFFEW